jgi:3-isopropylmalate/(R)-2-methylmalate dehydratase small subunit
MQPLTHFTGIVAPLDRANVDTDSIIPKQYLKSIKRSGFGVNLFDDWRYQDPGKPDCDHSARRLNTDFVLNQPCYRNAQILLGRKNFGCGSSREHAVWALLDAGFRAVIAPSFADIFYNNSLQNGLLPIVLVDAAVDRLFGVLSAAPGFKLRIDLVAQTVTTPDGETLHFEIDLFNKHRLVNGLDDIDLTLQHAEEIRQYEARRRREVPWLF